MSAERTETIHQGERRTIFAALAKAMWQAGKSPSVIEKSLRVENEHCVPPLSEIVIRQIAVENSKPFTVSRGLSGRAGVPLAAHPLRRDPAPRATAAASTTRDQLPKRKPQFHLTEMGNAERFARDHCEYLRFVHDLGSWHIWNGQHWAKDKTGEVMGLAGETVRRMYDLARTIGKLDKRTNLVGHAMKSESERILRAMLQLAKSQPPIATEPAALDRDPFLLTVENGTLDLHTCALRDHRPEDLITHCAPTAYDPTAECPRWRKFLSRIFDEDDDLISFVQRAVGYSLTGSTREQCFFLLHGTGANGKSTFLEVLRSLLGSLAQSARFESFLVKRNDGIPNDIARMRGARLVTANEAEGQRRLSESVIKELTGGDTISARLLHREFFEFRPTFKLWLAANHKPVIRGTDHAIWRRVKLVPFAVTIPEPDRDLDLLGKLRHELPGILAWAVEGCREWKEHGLGEADSVTRHTAQYREDSDTLRRFVEDECVLGADLRVKKGELYKAYQAYCAGVGDVSCSKAEFGQRLRTSHDGIGDTRGTGGVWYWLGIGLVVELLSGASDTVTEVTQNPV